MSYAKIDQLTLPTSAQLSDGRWVSNYDKLPVDTLLKEGWLPLTEVRPLLSVGRYHELDSVVSDGRAVTATYKAVAPPPDPVQAELDRYKLAVAEVTAINTATALKTTLVDAVNRLKTAVEVKTEPIVKEIVK